MAITRVGDQRGNNGTGTINVVNPNSVAVGDLLIGFLFWDGITINVNPTLTDTVNAGSWNLPGTLQFTNTTNQVKSVVGWIRCDTSGTPTITGGSLGTQGTALIVIQYTGFATGHPALVNADILVSNGNSTSPSASLTNTISGGEAMWMGAMCQGGQNFASFTGSMSSFRPGDADDCYASQIVTTASNSITWGATISSAQWVTILAGWSDQPPATNNAPIAWIT
jgi:hypothetical protein